MIIIRFYKLIVFFVMFNIASVHSDQSELFEKMKENSIKFFSKETVNDILSLSDLLYRKLEKKHNDLFSACNKEDLTKYLLWSNIFLVTMSLGMRKTTLSMIAILSLIEYNSLKNKKINTPH